MLFSLTSSLLLFTYYFKYPGVAQLVARVVWEHRLVSPHTKSKTAESPSTMRISGGSENEIKRSKMCLTTDLTTYTTTIK